MCHRGFTLYGSSGRRFCARMKLSTAANVLPILAARSSIVNDVSNATSASHCCHTRPCLEARSRDLAWRSAKYTRIASRHSPQSQPCWYALAVPCSAVTGRYYELHECRHTAATLLLSLGVDPVVMTRILGHSTIASSQAYMHADLSMVRAALEGAADRLGIGATLTDRVVESRVD